MDRFVAHCVATALITAALAAASTVRAESSGAEAAPAGSTGAAAAAAAPIAVPAARVPDASVPMIPARTISVPMIPAPAVPAPGVSGPAAADPTVSAPSVPAADVTMPVASPLSPDNPAPTVDANSDATSDTAATATDAAAGLDTDLKSGISKGAVCADARQVGPTVYARWHGETIFSVKQYYSPSCHARYSYGYPWLHFRDQHAAYDIGLAVFDTTHDALDGAVTYVDGVGSPNYWSAPVAMAPGTCTEATVHLFLPDDESDTYSQGFCS